MHTSIYKLWPGFDELVGEDPLRLPMICKCSAWEASKEFKLCAESYRRYAYQRCS